jgi:hypothetical protein
MAPAAACAEVEAICFNLNMVAAQQYELRNRDTSNKAYPRGGQRTPKSYSAEITT